MGLRSVDEQLARVLALGSRLAADNVAVGSGIGRTLAADLPARVDVPPFDNSAMDGFAVRAADLFAGVALRVVGDIPAGATSVPTVGAGEAARIMTGAPLPPGADAVVPVEQTDQPMGAAALPSSVVVAEPVAVGRHVRRRGEDIAAGAAGLAAGLRWSPAAASAAASLGYGTVALVRRPRVAVLSTGSELAPAGQDLAFGQIPDSNSILLAGLCRQWGAEVLSAEAVDDDPARFREALARAMEADLVLTSGGVSVGAFEVVRQVVEGEISFDKVAMQPGKPQASGLLTAPDGRRVPMLGLPGNPVSVNVSAWVYARPLIARLGGWSEEWRSERLLVLEGWGGPAGRRQFTPVRIGPDGVAPVHRLGSGSHLVASLALADGLAVVPEDVTSVAPGDLVDVYRVAGS